MSEQIKGDDLDLIGAAFGVARDPGESDTHYRGVLAFLGRYPGQTAKAFWDHQSNYLKNKRKRMSKNTYDPTQVVLSFNGIEVTGVDYTIKAPESYLKNKRKRMSKNTYDPTQVTFSFNGVEVTGTLSGDIVSTRATLESHAEELRRKLQERAEHPRNNLTMAFGYEGDD